MKSYHVDIQYVPESVTLLNMVARPAPYITNYMNYLASRYGVVPDERAGRVVDLLQEIEDAARAEFSGDMETVKFYCDAENDFSKPDSFANILVLVGSVCDRVRTVQEQAEYYNRKYLEQRERQEKSSLEEASAGDTVDFGEFSWIVADRSGAQLTLVLKTAAEDSIFGPAAYHEDAQDVTWADCSLRAYLNTEALEAFSPAEQEAMVPQVHTPAPNPSAGTQGGEETEDLIRIPDAAEAQQYLKDGLFSAPGADAWLCTPGHDRSTACVLTKGGRILEYGDLVTDELDILAVTVVDYTKLGQ